MILSISQKKWMTLGRERYEEILRKN
jgi:hypothetical protein